MPKSKLIIPAVIIICGFLLPLKNKSKGMPPGSLVVGLPVTIATSNYVGYAGVNTTSFLGAAAVYNMFFDKNFSLGVSGGLGLALDAVNPAFIGGGLSLNYIITGGGSTDLEGDFLTLRSYPEFTSYVGFGFAAKQFDFNGQFQALVAQGENIVAGPTDIPSGVFYGMMIVGGFNWNFYNSMVLGTEAHFILSLGADATRDPFSNMIELIIGVGYMI